MASFLTYGDMRILPLATRTAGGFHIATRWYLRGFDPLPYQYAYHQLLVPSTTWLAGVAAGKTVTSAASCTIDCITIPYFKCLNTSVTAKQAELAFDKFMAWYEGNPRLEHLVEDIKLRPWPVIKFKNYSEWEFRTAGTDARFIRGSEYDRIVFDECGLDLQGEIIKVLRSRLRGRRPDGSPRMCRLDAITSPTDALWLRERFERGLKGSERYNPKYVSIRSRTRDNTRLTEEQIAAMEAELTDEMIAVEMDAEFPDYGLSLFPKSGINACTSMALNDELYIALNPEDGSKPKPGYAIEEHPRHGITKFEMPYNPEGLYVLAGDPGTDDPPKRNAGAVGVLDISKRPYKLVYFEWVAGRGSYRPFLSSYKYAINKYRPALKLLDTTGPQKMMQELAFEQFDIETDGVNFGRDKDGALNALSLALTNHDLAMPLIKGLNRQLSTYTREMDKRNDFPQDLTMMMAMLALGIRYAPEENTGHEIPVPAVAGRSRHYRTNRARRR